MMKAKYGWLAAAAMLALSAGFATAQAPDSPPPGPPPDGAAPPAMAERMPGPDRELKTLTRVLGLTAEQQTSVKTILEQQAAEMRTLRAKNQSSPETANTPEAREARMAQAEQIRDASNTKITALLNDSQKATFADWIAKRKAAMERRRQQGDGNGPPPPPPDGGGPPPNE